METVQLRSVTLSNFEVMRFLQEQRDEMNQQKGDRKDGKKKKKRVNKSLLTVTVETLAWLESQPASVQSEEIIKSFLDKLKKFQTEENVSFKKSEIFLLINQRPVSPVEIQLLIENSEERLTEAQVESLLEMVADSLPSHVTESDEGEEEDQEEDEEGGEPPDIE